MTAIAGGENIPKYKLTQSEKEILDKGEWLTDRERKVFELYFKRGWHIEDVAVELDVCRNTINRALKGIRDKASKRDEGR